MRDYWLTKELLHAVGIGFGLLVLLGLALALALPKRWWGKLTAAAAVCVFFSFPVREAHEELQLKREEIQAYRQRLNKAQTMFRERCKTAGEKIYRTVDDVEGIFLMKVRPESIDYNDQFKLDDPYGRDLDGDAYILNFTRGFYHQSGEKPIEGSPPRVGYLFVEVIDSKDGVRRQYAGSKKIVGRMDSSAPNVQVALKRDPNFDLNIYRFVLGKAPVTVPAAQYGVTYDDISTHQEREYWIAGSSLKVVDLRTNEIVAERVGYMMDRTQGGQGGRSAWLRAADNACPSFQRNPLRPIPSGHGSSAQTGQTIDFVEKVLKPAKEK